MFLRIRLKKVEAKELIDEDNYKHYTEEYLKFIGVTPNFNCIESKIELYDFSQFSNISWWYMFFPLSFLW